MTTINNQTEVECYACGDVPCVKQEDPMDTRLCESCYNESEEIQKKLDQSEMERERKQCGEWYADFGKNYPLTQKYAQETMLGNIQQVDVMMATATLKIVEHMYREEDRHFREWIDEASKKDKSVMRAKLEEHIFYSLVVLKHGGQLELIDRWYDKYWEENGDPEPEVEFKFEELGIDRLVEIYALWKRKITNMKASSIPIDKRKKHIIDAIKKIIKESPDEKNIEIIKTYFAPKAPAEKKAKDPELSNYKVGDIVLCDAGKYRTIWTPAKVKKINGKSITIQLDEYRRIDDLDARRNQTYGKDRLVWLNCFGGAKKVIADSKNIWSKSDCETRHKGDMSYLLRYFDEGAESVDFGN